MSHPTWVRGLKQKTLILILRFDRSHPTWVRGLKLFERQEQHTPGRSHPTWVRGLKLRASRRYSGTFCRTLRGCVD